MKDSKTSKELKQDAGSKYDREKLRMDLIPVSAIEGLAEVLTYGANKYADRNWEKGISWSRCFGAAMRHLWAWYRGENLDPESGISHLHHALCNVAFLVEFAHTRRELDDRPIRTNGSIRHSNPGIDWSYRPDNHKQPAEKVLGGKSCVLPTKSETTESTSWEDEAPQHPEKQNPSNCSDSSWGV